MIKLSMIRDIETLCPFGLEIISACQTAGDTVERMAPLSLGEDELEQNEIKQANHRLFLWQADGNRCKYAGKIISNPHPSVECNFGESDQGEGQSVNFMGSPDYIKEQSGVGGLNGVFTFPVGLMQSDSLGHPTYYSDYSVESLAEDINNLISIQKSAKKGDS